jgi:hypothetical protein
MLGFPRCSFSFAFFALFAPLRFSRFVIGGVAMAMVTTAPTTVAPIERLGITQDEYA